MVKLIKKQTYFRNIVQSGSVEKTKQTFFRNVPEPLSINLIGSSVTDGTGSATFDNPIPPDEYEPTSDPTDPESTGTVTICIDCIDPPPGSNPTGPIILIGDPGDSGSYYPPIDIPETGSVVINGKYRWFFEGYFEPTVDFDESKLYSVFSYNPFLYRLSTKITVPLDEQGRLAGQPSDWYWNEPAAIAPGFPAVKSREWQQPGRALARNQVGSIILDNYHNFDSVATSYTGDVFAVGKAYYDFHRGGVWVWEYNWTSDSWIERKLPDPPGLEDLQEFGSAIAINQTGDTIAVASSRVFAGFFGLVSGSSQGTIIANGYYYEDQYKNMMLVRLRDKIYWNKTYAPQTRWVLLHSRPYPGSSGVLGGYAQLSASFESGSFVNSKDLWNPASGSWEQNILQMFPGVPSGDINDLRDEYAVKKQKISIYKKTYDAGFDNPVWTHVQEIELSGTLEQIAKLQEPALDFGTTSTSFKSLYPSNPLYFSLDNSLYVKKCNKSRLAALDPDGFIGLKFGYSFQNQEYDSPTVITYEEIDQIIENEQYNLGLENLSEETDCLYVDIPWVTNAYSTYVEEFKEKEKIVIKNPAGRIQYGFYGFTKISGLSNLIISNVIDHLDKYPMSFVTGAISNYSCRLQVKTPEWLISNGIECDNLVRGTGDQPTTPNPTYVIPDDWQCDSLPVIGGNNPNNSDNIVGEYSGIGLNFEHMELFPKTKYKIYKKKLVT